MANVDIISFKCLDEQEFWQDEVYAYIENETAVRASPTYENLDTGDKIYPDVEYLPFSSYATVGLMEDDGPEGWSGDDDIIGAENVYFTPDHIGKHTITLTGSGAEYELTYNVWA